MSPVPAAGTYRRSAGTVHAQRQVPRKRLAESSGVDTGPGPGPGGRSGLVGGVPGLAAAYLETPCSLVVPPGRHQIAPQSLGWARVHHRPWGVEFRRPRQAADPLGVLSCRRALSPAVRIAVIGPLSARSHEAPCSWQLFFASSRSRLIGCVDPS